MEVVTRKNIEVSPHPDFFEVLFAYKNTVSNIFKDVLGLYNINHIAITYIDKLNKLITFSSTPSLEFNLFKSNLWHFDKTYQNAWYTSCNPSSWQSLYLWPHYKELYQLKQIRHEYPIGLSLPANISGSNIIYSIASHKDCQRSQDIFATEHHNFYKIGQYCNKLLFPILEKQNNFNPLNNENV